MAVYWSNQFAETYEDVTSAPNPEPRVRHSINGAKMHRFACYCDTTGNPESGDKFVLCTLPSSAILLAVRCHHLTATAVAFDIGLYEHDGSFDPQLTRRIDIDIITDNHTFGSFGRDHENLGLGNNDEDWMGQPLWVYSQQGSPDIIYTEDPVIDFDLVLEFTQAVTTMNSFVLHIDTILGR